MAALAREVLSIARQRLDLRAGLLGLAVVSAFGVAIVLVGPVAISAAIGALIMLSKDPPRAVLDQLALDKDWHQLELEHYSGQAVLA